ncbi:MAG TPA: hypothetical protein PKD91_11690, partial [Bacteroidia bacterium]|nr:hypothetical protein [Bacteroidia bacterium]
SVVSGSGTFADASSPATTVSNLSTSQPNIFKWTVSNGCNSSNDEVQVNVFTAPPANQPVTTGPITGCKGDTLHYVTNLVAPTLVWEARPEGEIISGQGTQNVTIIFGNTTSTGYHACVTGTNACGTSRAKCVAIRSNSSTPSFRLAPVDVCDGSTVVYKCNNVAGAVRYRWSAPANILINGNQSPYITTDTSVSIYFPTGFGSAKIAVAASAGCDFGVNREINVSSTPLVPYAITGAKADLCNTLQTYSIRSREHQTYRWTVPAGATIQYTSPTTDTIKVLFGSSVTGNIIVVAQNSCGNNSLERKLAVTSFPPTPGLITGPTDVCPNTGGYVYSVAAVPNATSYQWTLPAGATITSGAGTNSIEVQYANAINKVSVQAIGSCGTSAKRNLTIVSNCRVVSQPEKSKDVISQPSATTAVEFNLQAYPDAQSKVLTVTFNAAQEGVYEYKIFNEADTEVKSGEIDAVNGSNMEQIDMSALPNATYRIVLENETVSHQLNVRFF